MPWNDTTLIECTFDPASGRTGDADRPIATGASFMQPVGDIGDQRSRRCLEHVDRSTRDRTSRRLTAGTDEIGGPAWIFGLRDHGVARRWPPCLGHGGRPARSTASSDRDRSCRARTAGGRRRQSSPRSPAGPTGRRRSSASRWTRRRRPDTPDDPGDPARPSTSSPPPPLPVDAADISSPRQIEFPTADGATAYGWFYAPVNSAVTAPAGRPAAARRDDPRRSDRRMPGHGSPSPTSSGPPVASRSSTSTIAARPATARRSATCSTATGAWSTSRTASPPPPSSPTKGSSTAIGW